MGIRDLGSGMETVRIRDPGWKKVRSGIRDKHPGPATLLPGSRTGIFCTAKSYRYIHSIPIGSVADPDPGSGIRCLFDPWIRDPE